MSPSSPARSGNPDAVLGWGEMLSYAGGSVASNLSWNMVAGFLLVYYTDVALLPVAAIGTLLLATRVFDAVFDPVAGILLDKTRTRWGKARPYLLFASVPFAVISVLVFSVPVGAPAGTKLASAYLTFGLLGLFYSFLYVPYGALQPLLTADRRQLLTTSGLRAAGTSVASIFVYGLALPAVALFGGGATGYRGAAVFFAVCTTALYLVTFFNCRERVARDPAADRSRLSVAVPNMLRNPIWRVVMAFELLIFVRLGIFASAMAFYARLVLGSTSAVALLLPALSIGILTGSIVAPAFLRRFSKRVGMTYVLLFTIGVFLLVPVVGHQVMPFAVLLFLGSMGNGVQAAMAFALIAESVELQEERFGKRDAGLLTSIASFNQKVGFAVGSAVVAWALSAVGYSPSTPSPAVATMLGWLMCAAPVLVALLQIAIISRYRFDGVPIGRSGQGESLA